MSQQITEKISGFFSQYPQKQFSPKEIVVHAGNNLPGIFFLVQGEVKQYDITPNGDEVTLNVFKQGAFFPMSWAINRTQNNFFFEAISDTTAHLCPADEALEFLKNNPDVTLDLLSRVYVGIDGLTQRMSLLMKGSAYSRTVFELTIATKRFGQPTKTGIQLTITENDLASRAGLTRETISRELQKLAKKGFIKIAHKNILIKDLGRLESELSNSL